MIGGCVPDINPPGTDKRLAQPLNVIRGHKKHAPLLCCDPIDRIEEAGE